VAKNAMSPRMVTRRPICSNISLRPAAQGSDHLGIGAAFTTSSRSDEFE
jgi:hypothetical protein